MRRMRWIVRGFSTPILKSVPCFSDNIPRQIAPVAGGRSPMAIGYRPYPDLGNECLTNRLLNLAVFCLRSFRLRSTSYLRPLAERSRSQQSSGENRTPQTPGARSFLTAGFGFFYIYIIFPDRKTFLRTSAIISFLHTPARPAGRLFLPCLLRHARSFPFKKHALFQFMDNAKTNVCIDTFYPIRFPV